MVAVQAIGYGSAHGAGRYWIAMGDQGLVLGRRKVRSRVMLRKGLGLDMSQSELGKKSEEAEVTTRSRNNGPYRRREPRDK